jgi:hypothetical protein
LLFNCLLLLFLTILVLTKGMKIRGHLIKTIKKKKKKKKKKIHRGFIESK